MPFTLALILSINEAIFPEASSTGVVESEQIIDKENQMKLAGKLSLILM